MHKWMWALLTLALLGAPARADHDAGGTMIGTRLGELQRRTGLVTMKGNPVTLLGPELKVGESAPDFRVVDSGFQPVDFESLRGKPILIAAVPSLDTKVCALETKRFNDELAALPADVQLLTISMDLPFAQMRFCDAEHIDRVRVLSDHVWREFGTHYGVLIENLGLLARSIFVVGRDGKITYREIVPELGQQPNYDAALEAIRRAAS
jgi:thioredoxin-dependent peroxiredoxin